MDDRDQRELERLRYIMEQIKNGKVIRWLTATGAWDIRAVKHDVLDGKIMAPGFIVDELL